MTRFLVGFARFWYDFLVGDSLPLALGAIAICVFAIAADRSSIHGAMEFLLPALVLVTLALSLRDTRG